MFTPENLARGWSTSFLNPPPWRPFLAFCARAELEVVKGSKLVGLKYEPMFKFFADREQSFVVCEDNYVTNDSGTGIVHQVGGYCS